MYKFGRVTVFYYDKSCYKKGYSGFAKFYGTYFQAYGCHTSSVTPPANRLPVAHSTQQGVTNKGGNSYKFNPLGTFWPQKVSLLVVWASYFEFFFHVKSALLWVIWLLTFFQAAVIATRIRAGFIPSLFVLVAAACGRLQGPTFLIYPSPRPPRAIKLPRPAHQASPATPPLIRGSITATLGPHRAVLTRLKGAHNNARTQLCPGPLCRRCNIVNAKIIAPKEHKVRSIVISRLLRTSFLPPAPFPAAIITHRTTSA